MTAKPAAGLPALFARFFRCLRITAVATLITLVCSGVTSCTKTQVSLSVAAMAAVVVGTTVGVTLAVQHSHHTLQGCISSGVDGTELRLGDNKIYTLTGELADVKVGNRLKIHGSRVKGVKGKVAGGQVFVVEKVNKDYGPCPARLVTSSTPLH